MASLIDPKCGAQSYSIDEATASRCGGYAGGIGGLLLGVTVAVVLAVALKPVWAKIVGAVAAVLILPLLLWWIGSFVGRRTQQTANVEIDARIKSGMSRSEAIRSVQDLQNSQRSANAVLGAGAMVASSFVSDF